MVADADDTRAAATIAAILTERGLGGDDVDLRHRLDQFRRDRSRRADDARAMVERWVHLSSPSPERGGSAGEAGRGGVKDQTTPTRLASRADLPLSGGGKESAGALLALAYPDRIAKNRGGGTGAFRLANGRGGAVDPASALAREPFLTVAELTGAAASSRIVLAAPIALDEIEARFAADIEDRETVTFDAASATLRARRMRRLGAVMLTEQVKPVVPDANTAKRLAEGIAALGIGKLPWSKAQLQLRHRVAFLRRADLGFTRDRQTVVSKSAIADLDGGDEWPDLSDDALARAVTEWLAPFLADKTALAQIGGDDLAAALDVLLPWRLRKRLDTEAPTHFTAPTGSHVPIDYEAEQGTTVSIRVQELFGLAQHPSIAGGRLPLIVELLSPAQRPVQVTRDLPGFWRGSYAQVKSEMRGRYPKHPWPDDPLTAPATRRAKPRGQ
jgi:ATP-dependent helicase HrpB